jgi:hypothetical protein
MNQVWMEHLLVVQLARDQAETNSKITAMGQAHLM